MATLVRTHEALNGLIVYDNTATGSVGQLTAPASFDIIKIHPNVAQLHGVTNLAFAFTFADVDAWVKARIEGSLDGTNFASLMEIADAIYTVDGTYHIIWTRLGAFTYMKGVFVSESASPSDAVCDLIVRAGA